jgi:hypothetical protein
MLDGVVVPTALTRKGNTPAGTDSLKCCGQAVLGDSKQAGRRVEVVDAKLHSKTVSNVSYAIDIRNNDVPDVALLLHSYW